MGMEPRERSTSFTGSALLISVKRVETSFSSVSSNTSTITLGKGSELILGPALAGCGVGVSYLSSGFQTSRSIKCWIAPILCCPSTTPCSPVHRERQAQGDRALYIYQVRVRALCISGEGSS